VSRLITTLLACLVALGAGAQEQPELRVNLLNVCAPEPAEKAELAAALSRIPVRPALGPDYEVARGRTTQKSGASDWVRMRREFTGESSFSNVQFLLTVEPRGVDEKFVWHTRNSKPGEPLQIALEQNVTAATAAEALAAGTPPSRIRLERFGKAPLVLARCADTNQTEYEPLFQAAAERFSSYRAALKVRSVVAGELARLAEANTNVKPARQAGSKRVTRRAGK
jgi:hypothetical protein